MSVIRWLVVQEVCSRFEFACHFESHLAWPPPFYMRMRITISDEQSIVTMLHVYSSHASARTSGILLALRNGRK